MSYSIYSSMFNVEKMKFEWRDAIKNWHEFLDNEGQIVIAVNTSEDDSYNLIKNFCDDVKRRNPYSHTNIEVISTNFDYSDPEFDGKIKNAALEKCKEAYAISLDCDEKLLPEFREAWNYWRNKLEMNGFVDAVFIPVIDLFHDERSYKSIGTKWYLHKNNPNICRGVVKWAYREDGSIDISKSDTCELKYKDSGELVRSIQSLMMGLPDFVKVGQLQSGNIPFVYHYGWLDKEQRLRQDHFWGPVWRNRDKSDVKTEKTMEELKKIQYFPHNLPLLPKY